MLPVSGCDEDSGTGFQAHKTAFFFKLERELEKVDHLQDPRHCRTDNLSV